MDKLLGSFGSKKGLSLFGSKKGSSLFGSNNGGNKICNIITKILGPLERILGKLGGLISKFDSKIAGISTYTTMPINIFTILVLLFIIILLIVKLIIKFLNWFGIHFDTNVLNWLPSKNMFYWTASLYKFILNIFLVAAIVLGVPKLMKASKADSLYLILVNMFTTSKWIYVILGLIIGNGLIMGLYKLVCDNSKTNLAGFVTFADLIFKILGFICLIIMFLLRMLKCDSMFSVHKVLIVGIICYFLLQVLIVIAEYVISENLYFLLGLQEAYIEDCRKEDEEDDKYATLKYLLHMLLTLLLWPLIIGIVVLQGLPPLATINSQIGMQFGTIIDKIGMFLLGSFK